MVFLLNLRLTSFVLASSSFSEDFSSTTNINKSYDFDVDTSAKTVKLKLNDNALPDSNTRLLSHLGSNSDITSPAIGTGGAVSGVTYGVGQDGNAANLDTTDQLTFPISGNIDINAGTISIWVKLADWNTAVEKDIFAIPGLIYLFQSSSNKRMYFQVCQGAPCPITISYDVSGFAAGSWHQFIITYDIAYTGKAAMYIDGNLAGDIARIDPYTPSTSQTNMYIASYMNRYADWVDELRITSTQYGPASSYSEVAILESKVIDTGVSSPVWGNISWGATKPNKTDVQLQTSTSDDGSTWSGWITKGMITFFTDDSRAETWDNEKPILDAAGFKASFSVVPDFIGGSGNLTLSQVQALHNNGWTTYTEGKSHTVLSTLTPAELPDYFFQTHQYLVDNGLDHSTFAPAGGTEGTASTTKQQKDIVINYFEHAWGWLNTFGTSGYHYNTFDKKYNITASNGYTLSTDLTYVDAAAQNYRWYILYWHKIGVDISIADFQSLVNYIATANVDVVTLDQALDRIVYNNKDGTQVTSGNKRYIRYRAILSSYDQTNTPTLSSIKISAPAKIYKNIATTINSDGTFDHATWPQTTDTSIDNLTVTPNTGSATVTVDTWNTTGNYYKKWTETGSSSGITTAHAVGDLNVNTSYDVKVDGELYTRATANSSGQITFTYSGGYSTKTFEVQKTPDPAGAPVCNDTAPGSAPWLYNALSESRDSIRIYFTDAKDPVDKYVLEYGTEPGVYQFSSTNIGGKGTKTYLVEWLSPDKTYYFRVRGGNGCATGPWSNEISAKTKSSAPLTTEEKEELERLRPGEEEEISKEEGLVKETPKAAIPEKALLAGVLQRLTTFLKNTGTGVGNFVGNVFRYTKETVASGYKTIAQGIRKPKELTSRFGEWISYSAISFREIVLDKEPTKISSVKVEKLTSTSAVIYWKTNHLSDSKVNWGETLDYGKTAQKDEKVHEHRIEITGLEPETKYFYEVMSQNKNYVYDANHEFTTPKE